MSGDRRHWSGAFAWSWRNPTNPAEIGRDGPRLDNGAAAPLNIRLQGIDAPELGQPFGRVARDRLAAMAKGKTATIHATGKDRYGRVLATVEIEHDDLGRRLVAEGLAWHYTRYSDDAGLAAAERDARAAGSGLWGGREPVPPWEWRASEKARKANRGEPAGR